MAEVWSMHPGCACHPLRQAVFFCDQGEMAQKIWILTPMVQVKSEFFDARMEAVGLHCLANIDNTLK